MKLKIKKEYWIYGIMMALLLFVLEWTQYRYFIRDISIELLISILAGVFILLGIWVGLNMKKRTSSISQGGEPEVLKAEAARKFNLSSRETEVLELLAEGFSNQEIAEKLFISLSTVKSHISNIYTKLEVKRRTQAVQKAKSSHLVS